MKRIIYCCLLVGILTACNVSKNVTSSSSTPISIEGKLFASVYQQRAAEYHALCLQAYNIAQDRFDQLIQVSSPKPKAIITDIDETLLDNSAYDVHQAMQGKDFESAAWHQWTAMAKADTVPGALSFLKYAAAKGVEIFYITNREVADREVTLRNLQQFGFPNADDAHLQVLTSGSGKETRRQKVIADHEVILLLGDNLSDFSDVFDKKIYTDRKQAAIDQAAQFGRRFIVLPNPVYGDWEGSLYRYNYSLSAAQKDSVIKSLLKNY